ncbi:hypothetical protein GAY28_08810 [Azospirillum brasilense]|nr:hypothetical protein [Azospirillum brasilense]
MILPLLPKASWTKPDWFEMTPDDRRLIGRWELLKHKNSVARLFPDFRLVIDAPWGCIWRGRLQPVAQVYEVEVSYFPGVCLDDVHFILQWPKVLLLSPAPERRSADPSMPIPHLYRQPAPGAPAHLCLYHPSGNEWNWDHWIGKTIIPWAAEWLAFYELWRITGRWDGPERHPALGAPKSALVVTDERTTPGSRRSKLRRRMPEWLNNRPLLAALGFAQRRNGIWGPPVRWSVEDIENIENTAMSLLSKKPLRVLG